MAAKPQYLTALQTVSFAKFLVERGVLTKDGMAAGRIMGQSSSNWGPAKLAALSDQYPDLFSAWAARERILGNLEEKK